jgi:HSP20 family protein
MELKVWSPVFDFDKEWRLDFPRLLDFPVLHRELTGFDYRPAIDLVKEDGELVVTVELPGVDPKDVEVSIEGDYVLIKGEKLDEKEVSEDDRYFRERNFGKFLRRFRLPEGTSADKMSAMYDKGVLTLHITLPEEKQLEPLHIPIEAKT